MKTIKCFNCKQSFKPRKEFRQRCPRCASEMWMTPTLLERLQEAWRAFVKPW